MEHSESFSIVAVAATILVAVVGGLTLLKLRQPPLVGYILAGVLMGPTGFGLISNNESVAALAEMGVLILLFFIGIELSIKAFIATLRPAAIVATGQLIAGLLLGGIIMMLTGASLSEGLILGFILSLSSTVVAMKMLEDMGVLRRRPGRITVGVMIAQDIAVVPMLLIVASLSPTAQFDIGALILRIIVAVGLLALLIVWLGRSTKLHMPFEEQIGGSVGTAVPVVTGHMLRRRGNLRPCRIVARLWRIRHRLVIGSSTLRNRVIPVIAPIQSVLVVVFFLSIGLLIDLDYVISHFLLVLTASLCVIAVKTMLNIALLRLTGFNRETSLVGGLSMAQIGEFSFVLASTGFVGGAMGEDIYRLAIAVTAISLLLSPLWVSLMHRLEALRLENFATYRSALSTAYAEEIGTVRSGLWWLRVRYRAWKIFRAGHRKQRVEEPAGSNPEPASTKLDT